MVVRSRSGTLRYIEAHYSSRSRIAADWLAG
jgi:hypothetical protein